MNHRSAGKMSVRNLLKRTALGLSMSLLQACGGGDGSGDIPASMAATPAATITLMQVFSGVSFNQPVAMLQAPGDSSRWFVVERPGRVRSFQNAAAVASAGSFIDITDRVDSTSGGEMGLLGMAFHPSFPGDARVFLCYTVTVNGQKMSRVSAFTSADNGATLDASSESILLTVNQPESNHKGGSLAFGSDGYLYIGFGDGGGEGDQHTANGPNGNAQSLTTLLGKILRIDVNAGAPYGIPTDNPFKGGKCTAGSGSANCPEIYAYGFRNPWRFSFDRVTGELWVGDVGAQTWEEIDQVVSGGNYGWRYREGAHCYNPPSGCPTSGLLDPVAEYDHSLGIAVIGGYVYRGTQTTDLKGRYLFADFGSGRIWAWIPEQASQPRTPIQLADTMLSISSFAQGNDGELYIVDYGGLLYRVMF